MEASECLEAWKLGSWQELQQRGTQKGQKEGPRFFVQATANPARSSVALRHLLLLLSHRTQAQFDAAVVEVLRSAHDACLELSAHGGACCNTEDSTLRKMRPCRRFASGTMQPQCFRNRYRIPSRARLLTTKAGPSDGRSAPLLYPATPALLPLHTTLFLRRPQLFSPKWKKCSFNQRALFDLACGVNLSF